MDLLVLQRLTAELDERLRGARIEQIWALPRNDVVIAVGRRSAPRLWFSAEPDEPHMYLRDAPHTTPARPPGFAMAARHLLSGRPIDRLRVLHDDRLVELRCGGQAARLLFELIPRRATAYLVDETGQVRAVWQQRKGRPQPGDDYEPPGPDRRPALGAVEAATWKDLAALPDEGARVRGLLRSIAGMSPLVAREIARRHAAGEPLPQAADAEIRRADEEPVSARIYSPAPLDELADMPEPRRFVLAPYALHHLEDDDALHVTPFPTLIDAASTYYPARACLAALQGAREALSAALDTGCARAARALDAVSGDRESAGDAELHRQHGDLLLAYPDAPREGAHVRVPDPYADEEGAEREIRIDPQLSRVDNAQAYYQRARRADRGAKRTAARRDRLRRRTEALLALQEQVATADLSACARAARQARRHGVDVDTARWVQAECPAAAPAPGAGTTRAEERRKPRRTGRARRPAGGVVAYTSSDGFEILVGRSAAGNERLTHKMAAPHDFWLHAEGPGSHVVIRNPQRDDEPSADALREAASLAAYFSRSRRATKVNVRWTQARHVKKPRGAPTGQVVLRASSTYLAEPLAPEDLFATGED